VRLNVSRFKGILSRDKYFLRLIIINSYLTFCFLVDEKIKLKVLACSFEIQCCGTGMFIPDPDFYLYWIPGPKTATKERGEKKFVSYLFMWPQISQN
jgi:hypothetical protein